MRKLFIAGILISIWVGSSEAENIVIDVSKYEDRLIKLAEMHGKECSPVEFAYAETYIESLKGGKSKTTREEKKRSVVKEGSIQTLSYPIRIEYYLSLIEKNIYSDNDGDGIPCYKEIELGLNPNVVDRKEISFGMKKEEETVFPQKEEKEEIRKEREEVNPLNQPVRVHFYFNRADIKKEYLPYLNVVVKFLKMHRDVKVKIAGYTDSIGSKDYNSKLALKRAESVKNYLVKNGIEPSRIFIEGVGKDKYLTSNDKKIDRFTNRRAEFYVINLAE
ncbi:MAG: OmpA family protein [Hydrogenothermaceae bacterium]|nr:OmpA family protein [Hydrogenothermaceae bacterium]